MKTNSNWSLYLLVYSNQLQILNVRNYLKFSNFINSILFQIIFKKLALLHFDIFLQTPHHFETHFINSQIKRFILQYVKVKVFFVVVIRFMVNLIIYLWLPNILTHFFKVTLIFTLLILYLFIIIIIFLYFTSPFSIFYWYHFIIIVIFNVHYWLRYYFYFYFYFYFLT